VIVGGPVLGTSTPGRVRPTRQAAASSRRRTRSFSSRLWTWFLTVRTSILSWWAICLLVQPSSIRASTSRSRGVRRISSMLASTRFWARTEKWRSRTPATAPEHARSPCATVVATKSSSSSPSLSVRMPATPSSAHVTISASARPTERTISRVSGRCRWTTSGSAAASRSLALRITTSTDTRSAGSNVVTVRTERTHGLDSKTADRATPTTRLRSTMRTREPAGVLAAELSMADSLTAKPL